MTAGADASSRIVLLLRHAQTEDARPGSGDIDRRLTGHGEDQARRLGERLRAAGVRVDAVLCSTAVRARQTMELLGLDWPDASRIDRSEAYYRAGTDTLIDALRELDETISTVLVVGHAPAVPGVVYELADPDTSDPAAAAIVGTRYPAGTLARLEFNGGWDNLGAARLTAVQLP